MLERSFFDPIGIWVSKTIGKGIANKHLIEIVLIFDIGQRKYG